ncbi:MAG: hypothetical protein WCF10_19260 [Polyangiales bacterium]
MSASNKYRRVSPAALVLLASYIGCQDGSAPSEPFVLDGSGKPAGIPDPYAHSASRFGIVPLHAGFSPDPRVVGGTAIGEVPADSIHRKCPGWISANPDYLLHADTAFFRLYVLGRSSSAVRLVLRKPDGSVICNNGGGKKDFMIRSNFSIGTTQVWVGVTEKGATADYRLGFSEVKSRPSSIRFPGDD